MKHKHQTERNRFAYTVDTLLLLCFHVRNNSISLSPLFVKLKKKVTFFSQVEIPNIQKQRKHLAKLVLDMDSARTRWVSLSLCETFLCGDTETGLWLQKLYLLWIDWSWGFPLNVTWIRLHTVKLWKCVCGPTSAPHTVWKHPYICSK